MNQDLYRRFLDRAGLEKPDDVQILRAIRDIPHGRPSQRTAEAVLTDWRGTCSSKLLLLRKILPHLQLRFYNRVFRLTPEMARSIMGTVAAAVIPPEGMIDVHTFATGIETANESQSI